MKLTVIIWGASYLHFDLSLRQNARMRYRTHDTHTSRIYSAVFNLSAVAKNYKQIVPLANIDDNFTFSPWWWVYPGDKYQKHTYQFANTLPPGKAHTPRRETVCCTVNKEEGERKRRTCSVVFTTSPKDPAICLLLLSFHPKIATWL